MLHRARRTKVFISYSHRDARLLDSLRDHLAPRVIEGVIEAWDDRRLEGGDRWQEAIEGAIASARVAVLLVSPQFLASDFIRNVELPLLLAAADAEGVLILPVILSVTSFE